MSVLENFKNIPRSPYEGATGLKYNFFSSNLQQSPWRKKITFEPCRPPIGRLGYIFEIFQNRHIFLKF